MPCSSEPSGDHWVLDQRYPEKQQRFWVRRIVTFEHCPDMLDVRTVASTTLTTTLRNLAKSSGVAKMKSRSLVNLSDMRWSQAMSLNGGKSSMAWWVWCSKKTAWNISGTWRVLTRNFVRLCFCSCIVRLALRSHLSAVRLTPPCGQRHGLTLKDDSFQN